MVLHFLLVSMASDEKPGQLNCSLGSTVSIFSASFQDFHSVAFSSFMVVGLGLVFCRFILSGAHGTSSDLSFYLTPNMRSFSS